MNHPQEEKVTGTRIVWTDEEWNTVAIALMKDPSYTSGLPDIIRAEDVRKAIEALPEARRRPVFSTVSKAFRPGLLDAYDRIRSLVGLPVTAPKPAPQVEPPPPPAPPAAKEEATGHRVFWKPEEYDALAHELYRMSPHARYEQSTTLAGLSTKEVLDAQRNVLPPHRRRALKHVVGVRPHLVEAFARIRNQLAFAEAQKFLGKSEPAAEPAPEPVAEVAAPEPAPALPAPPAAEEFNPHEIALRVLVQMLVPALAKELSPVLAKDMMSQLGTLAPPASILAQVPAAALQPVAPPVAAPAPAAEEEHDPLEFQPPASYQPPAPDELPAVLRVPEKPRLPMVAVLGLKPVQFQELRAAFPMLDIVTEQGHHSTKTLRSLQSAERVVVANNENNSMNAMTDKMLRQHFGDKYVRANGGMSMVKRQIQMWIHAGVFK